MKQEGNNGDIKDSKNDLFVPVIDTAIFNIPSNFNNNSVYLVLQISKILTSDSDKAIAPYIKSNTIPDHKKHATLCRRLFNYKQPGSYQIVILINLLNILLTYLMII